jgi:hypothetical protein
MSDLTNAEQAILDLVAERGPMSRRALTEVEIARKRGAAFADRVIMDEWQGSRRTSERLDSLLSRGLFLERKTTVECPTCKGYGALDYKGKPAAFLLASRKCPTCPPGYLTGTGSVKERVIGRPCTECRGRQCTQPSTSSRLVPCLRCSSTPTPGLDPGSESETEFADERILKNPDVQEAIRQTIGEIEDWKRNLDASERTSAQGTSPQLAPREER